MFTEAEIRKATFGLFLPEPALRADQQGCTTLQQMREALSVSQHSLAKKLSLTQPAIKHLEEKHDALAKIREVANALDCDIEIRFTPRRYQTFAEHFWRPAANEAQRSAPQSLRLAPANRRLLWLTAKINELIDQPEFRRDQGWSRDRQQRKLYVSEMPEDIRREAQSYFSPTT